ncbi:fumarylacetoacetate hydrolase family protein [Pelomyxa schiedti]|nr:fumarylacetoacetate hydrolase family protein [Pelomyxa schiedti]
MRFKRAPRGTTERSAEIVGAGRGIATTDDVDVLAWSHRSNSWIAIRDALAAAKNPTADSTAMTTTTTTTTTSAAAISILPVGCLTSVIECLRYYSDNGKVLLNLLESPELEAVVRNSTDEPRIMGCTTTTTAAATSHNRLPEQEEPAAVTLMPFEPVSLRDALLCNRHYVQASEGMVWQMMGFPAKAAMWTWNTLVGWWSGKAFPPLYPHKLHQQRPLYYQGSHTNMYTDSDVIPIPKFAWEYLDYELEVAIVVSRPGRNFTAGSARDAIGGYTLLNDFTARTLQISEGASGFGFVKTKSFATSLGSVVVTPDEVGPIVDLHGAVLVNNEVYGTGGYFPMAYTPEELLAFISVGENILPGEVIGMGTMYNCAGIEVNKRLHPQDTVVLKSEKLGTLTNKVVEEPTTSHWRDSTSQASNILSQRARLEVAYRL